MEKDTFKGTDAPPGGVLFPIARKEIFIVALDPAHPSGMYLRLQEIVSKFTFNGWMHGIESGKNVSTGALSPGGSVA